MVTNYSTSLTTYTNPSATDQVAVAVGGRTHSQFHSDNNDDIEALQAKVGIDGSAVTTSHDYKLSEVTGSDKAVGKTATQTLTNKTLTSPKINTPTITGLNISDEQFLVSDNADTTKQVEFEVSGATTGTKTTITASQTANRTVTLPDATDTLMGKATTDTMTNKSFNANGTGNSITNLETADFAANVVDTDGTLAANSDTRIASQKATKTYADAIAAGNGVITTFTGNVSATATSDTTIMSATIPGGTLGTGYMVQGRLHYTAPTIGASAADLIVKLKYGGTTVATLTVTSLTTNPGAGHVDFSLIASGATNTQEGNITLQRFTEYGANTGTFFINTGTGAEDSTGALTLSITAAWNSIANTPSVTFTNGWIRK